MNKKKLAFWVLCFLFAVSGYISGVIISHDKTEKASKQKTISKPDVWRHLPEVDGEIVACLPSPDYTRIAVLYHRATPLCRIPVIAIFDPEKNIFIGEIKPQVGVTMAPWTWSPDSKWLTVSEENDELRMISRNGQVKVIPLNNVMSDIIWREDQPGKFLYISTGLFEYDLDTQTEREIKTESTAVRLFTLNGKPSASEIIGDSNKTIRVYLIDTGESVLWITVPDEYSAIYKVELSPDGNFISIVCQSGMSVLGIIARRVDAKSVLQDRSKALFVEELPNYLNRVIWPIDKLSNCAIIDGYTVDLTDGCLKYGEKGIQRLARWKPALRNGRQIPQWLDIGRFGLVVCTDSYPQEITPLLGHKQIIGTK